MISILSKKNYDLNQTTIHESQNLVIFTYHL